MLLKQMARFWMDLQLLLSIPFIYKSSYEPRIIILESGAGMVKSKVHFKRWFVLW